MQAAGPLLDALAAVGDAQVGLRLLHTCARYGIIQQRSTDHINREI